jgi:hypothetical protein
MLAKHSTIEIHPSPEKSISKLKNEKKKNKKNPTSRTCKLALGFAPLSVLVISCGTRPSGQEA